LHFITLETKNNERLTEVSPDKIIILKSDSKKDTQ